MDWTPPEWVCNRFPLPSDGAEVVTMSWLIATLNAHIDTCTEGDTTALGQALHVAHMLVTRQGSDGRWPVALNLRTGEELDGPPTFTPIPLFRRMNALLDTSEFDHACTNAEDAGYATAGE